MYLINHYIDTLQAPGEWSTYHLLSHQGWVESWILYLKVQCIRLNHIHGALCLEYRVSWVRVPPEAAHFF